MNCDWMIWQCAARAAQNTDIFATYYNLSHFQFCFERWLSRKQFHSNGDFASLGMQCVAALVRARGVLLNSIQKSERWKKWKVGRHMSNRETREDGRSSGQEERHDGRGNRNRNRNNKTEPDKKKSAPQRSTERPNASPSTCPAVSACWPSPLKRQRMRCRRCEIDDCVIIITP
jgi:hypothetical protein